MEKKGEGKRAWDKDKMYGKTSREGEGGTDHDVLFQIGCFTSGLIDLVGQREAHVDGQDEICDAVGLDVEGTTVTLKAVTDIYQCRILHEDREYWDALRSSTFMDNSSCFRSAKKNGIHFDGCLESRYLKPQVLRLSTCLLRLL